MATPAVDDTAVFFPDRFGAMCEIFILGQVCILSPHSSFSTSLSLCTSACDKLVGVYVGQCQCLYLCVVGPFF